MNLNWKQIMATISGDDRFYMNTEEDEVTPKEAGWEFLRMYGNEDEDEDDEDEDDSEFSEAAAEEEEEVRDITGYESILCWSERFPSHNCTFVNSGGGRGSV